jgi:hypothetical protein
MNQNLDVQLNAMTKKQLFWQKVASLGVLGIFVVVLISALVMVPKVTMTLSNIDKVSYQVMESIEDIDAMVAEMTEASTGLNKLVSDNADTVTGAVSDLAGIDFEGLNTAIKDLQDTVAPFAAFFRQFR